MPRPRKSKAHKDLVNAKRQQRFRQRHPGTTKTTPAPAAQSDALPVLKSPKAEMGYGESACEVLGIVLAHDLRPILAENDAKSGLKFVQGHRVGVEQCIDAVESRLDQIARAWHVKRAPQPEMSGRAIVFAIRCGSLELRIRVRPSLTNSIANY
jgi:hypothetical protein